jgi:hypothetical protein
MFEEFNTFASQWTTPDGQKPEVNADCAHFMQEQIKVMSQTWNISLTQPQDESKGRKWALNREITVCAEDVHGAIKIAEREYPDGIIHKVQRAQSIHFFS